MPVAFTFPDNKNTPFTFMINQININYVNVIPLDFFNNPMGNKLLSLYLKKSEFPFMFDNPSQISPQELQQPLFNNLKSAYNALSANRFAKSISFAVGFGNQSTAEEVKSGMLLSENGNPFMFYDKNKMKFVNKSYVKEFFEPDNSTEMLEIHATDYSNSMSKEIEDLENEIYKVNGHPTDLNNSKTSAQETNDQTFSLDRSTAMQLENRKEFLEEQLIRINACLGTQMKLSLRNRFIKFIKQATEINNDQTVANKTETKNVEDKNPKGENK
jgi:hypothetical protein